VNIPRDRRLYDLPFCLIDGKDHAPLDRRVAAGCADAHDRTGASSRTSAGITGNCGTGARIGIARVCGHEPWTPGTRRDSHSHFARFLLISSHIHLFLCERCRRPMSKLRHLSRGKRQEAAQELPDHVPDPIAKLVREKVLRIKSD